MNKHDEGCEYDCEGKREDTVLSDVKNTEEEASSGNEGESSLSNSLKRSDNNDGDDDRTSAPKKL